MSSAFLRRQIFHALPFLDQGLISAGNLAIQIILARQLPNASYGRFILVQGVYFIFGVLAYSLVSYPLTLAASKGECENIGEDCGHTLLALGLGGLGAAAATLPFSPAAAILAVCFVTLQAHDLTRRVLIGCGRYVSLTITDLLVVATQCGGVMLASRHAPEMVSLWFLILAAAAGFGLAINSLLLHIKVRLSFSALRAIVGVAIAHRGMALSAILGIISWQLSNWLLALSHGASELGVSQSLFNIMSIVNPILFAMQNVLISTAASLRRSMSELVREVASRVAFPVAGAVAALSLVFCYPQVVLEAVYRSAISVDFYVILALRLLIAAYLVGLLYHLTTGMLSGLERIQDLLAVNIAALGVTLVAGILLIPLTGLMGVACTVLAANTVRAVVGSVLLLRFSRRQKAALWVEGVS